MADHLHPLHGFRAVADQGGALHRRGDAAVLDEIGLGRRKHVFAAGDIDLTAAEIHRVQAALDRADHVLGRILAGEHVGVGHPRHHQMRERFAAAVAGGGHAHQPRVVGVLHVAGEHAVLDQRRAACRRAFVVDVERAATARQGAVVDDGHARRRHALAHAAGVGRRALAVEIAFQAVADRFVQQHARPAVTQHHRHRARRRVDRFQIHQRLAQGFLAAALRAVAAQQFGVVVASAVAGAGRLAATVLLHDHLGVEAHQRPDVAGHHAVAAGDEHRVDRGAERHRDLAHARVGGAQQPVDATHRIEFRGVVVGVDRIGRDIQRLGGGHPGTHQRRRGAAVAVARDGFRGARSRQQRVGVDFV